LVRNEVGLPRRFRRCAFEHRFIEPCPGNGKHGKMISIVYFAPVLTCVSRFKCLETIKLLSNKSLIKVAGRR